MKDIIDILFFAMSDKALEFYSVIDTALRQSPRSLKDLGFYHVNMYSSPRDPTSYFYHETGTLVVVKPFKKIEENKPVVRIIGNDENSIERARSSLESITKMKLKGAIPLI